MSDETKAMDGGEATTPAAETASESAATAAVAVAEDDTRPVPQIRDGANGSLLERLELPVEVRFGELAWNLRRLLDLRVGDAVPVGPDGDDNVTLHVQGRPFASGELVVINGRFGFRVIEIFEEGASR